MKQNQFVRQNQTRWQEFENFCEKNNDNTPTDFGQRYRLICHDLAIARTRHYSPSLIDKLNAFVRLGQTQLYQNEGVKIKGLLTIFSHSFSQALYQNRYYMWGSLIAFWGLALVAYIWVTLAPDAVYYFLEPGAVRNIENMYDPAGKVQTDARGVAQDVMMFGVYIYNNIGIAFQMFGGGILFGVGALLPLLFNSFYFGAISAHIVNIGYQESFFSFVVTHGSFELTAIIIAGAAGCKIGFSLLNPGQYARAYAIKQAGKSVVPLIVGAFIMLVIAAIIEAFWSPLDIPSVFKYSVGAVFWWYIIVRLYKGTRFGY